MTERKLSDYLHFYLGCEVQIATRRMSTDGMIDDTRIGIFQGYWDNHRLSARIQFRAGPEGHCQIFFIKPILRPLSDMAYEEFVEAGKIHISEGGTIAVTLEEVRSNTVLPMRPKTFVYLLSKGFDLFNLIPDGLASDKTTLKQ